MTPTQPRTTYFITTDADQHGANHRAITPMFDEATDAEAALADIRQSDPSARLVEERQYR